VRNRHGPVTGSEGRPRLIRDSIWAVALGYEPGTDFRVGDELCGRLERQVAAGALFDVYRATMADGRRAAVKLAAAEPSDHAQRLFGAFTSIVFTRLFSIRGRLGPASAEPHGPATPACVLALEAERIAASEPWWNHSVITQGLVTISGGDAPIAALVTPWFDGDAFGALDRATQRLLWPRMIDALWRGLAAAPHGDLHPGQIIVAPAHDRFALIDPGVEWLIDETLPSGDGNTELVFLTNAEHYPIVPPYFVSPYPVASRQQLFETFIATKCGTETPMGRNAAACGPVVPGALDESEPRVADLLALGAIYYRVLTGRHPFYNERRSEPAWFGVEHFAKVTMAPEAEAMATRAVAPPRELAGEVRAAEETLCLALLDLSATDLESLRRLARDALA
jgi:hypothetical protein